ncbi:pyridoxal phosphate-dependent aminotransferase [Deinococcus soli (ex Cha et al. 2016)]|uniref:Aspartate aminotransferase n=2 Tax=Deinococcus soli (ex Cha et al. 2016) TaxID=1309411 RepID=A0ACC6KAX9_9DEIO|nr:pyridoxal phosphate-dependent aminotransferase [Deinococcus soli (ex Cha et al. 2016)]MDR6216535.1 aspartate aminotransferase [Deinococcus soli (ex Cha et al. 2016)]MDR6327356.1 aspartate aminotransferase [Deinococcus soli (ex Cha et al. 2016)]MDR6749631.1 aspartate aminotransferase [Deinococcus soli (ex Cha et al. 2016)]
MSGPFQLSERALSLKPSSTVAVTSRALELRRQGVDVISMSVGEPDFDTPDHVKAAAIAAIESGKTKYTAVNGTPELREAISAKFARENGLSYAPDAVTVTSGGKQALFNAFFALLNPGDEVLIPAPYWVSYPEMVALTGAVPVAVPTSPESGFLLDPEELEARVTPRTRMIVLNSPGNPTGAVFPPEVLRAVAAVAQKHNLVIVTDEMYEHLVYDAEQVSIGTFAPEHTLTINGASKAYAMTGWRIGYAGGPKGVIAAMNALQSQSTSNASSVSQYATLAALSDHAHTAAFVEMARVAYRERRDRIVAGLNALGLRTPTPQGAFYVMADTTPLHADELEAARRILDDARVAVVPGTDFAAPGQVRLSYATSMANIEEVLRRIGGLLNG